MDYRGADDQDERVECLKHVTEYLWDRLASVQAPPSFMDDELRNFTIASQKLGKVEQFNSYKVSQ